MPGCRIRPPARSAHFVFVQFEPVLFVLYLSSGAPPFGVCVTHPFAAWRIKKPFCPYGCAHHGILPGTWGRNSGFFLWRDGRMHPASRHIHTPLRQACAGSPAFFQWPGFSAAGNKPVFFSIKSLPDSSGSL